MVSVIESALSQSSSPQGAFLFLVSDVCKISYVNLFCHLYICHSFNLFLNHYLTYKESYNYDYDYYCLFCQAIDISLS